MSRPLYLVGSGAVTPVGLDAPQTCAGIRAGISRFEEVLRTSPFGTPQAVARIPAHWQLRRTPADWLLNLATRAAGETIQRHAVDPAQTALVLIPPEAFRQPSLFDSRPAPALAATLAGRLGLQFAQLADVPHGGAGALADALDLAAGLLSQGRVRQVILGAVDSYLVEAEYTRLEAAGRLRTEGTAQGFTPGEAAVFLLLSLDVPTQQGISAALLGWGAAAEPQSATSDSHAQGRAMLAALRAAAARAGIGEPTIDWVVSNANGERHASWETALTHARYYRTRRERLSATFPSMSVGETGCASAPLALLVAAHAFSRGYRRGRAAMIELSSEGAGRSACLVAPLGATP